MQWTPRNIDTAAWSLSPTSDGYFNIINANANMLLANSGGSLVISDSVAATSNDAKWDLISHGDYYEIKNIGAGKSLDVSGQSTADGGSVILYTFSGGDNELWTLSEISGDIEHVVPVVVDYSEKYDGTDYDYVSNVDSLTNDFTDSLKGFAVNNFAGLGSDGVGEAVLFTQNSLSNNSSTQRQRLTLHRLLLARMESL